MLKNHKKKSIEIINEFSKVAQYKINMASLVVQW